MAEERREVRFQGIYAVRVAEEDFDRVIGYAKGNPYDIEKVFSKRAGKNVRTEEINVERVTSSQAKAVGLEERVLSKEEFFKIFPHCESERPLHFSWDDGEERNIVVGYDCQTCDGVIVGRPMEGERRGTFVSECDYYCKRCDTQVQKGRRSY